MRTLLGGNAVCGCLADPACDCLADLRSEKIVHCSCRWGADRHEKIVGTSASSAEERCISCVGRNLY